jgi:hypothetical protein
VPEHVREVGEHVHDHEDAPDDEADGVHGQEEAAAVPLDQERDPRSEQDDGRGDEQRRERAQEELGRPFRPVALAAV